MASTDPPALPDLPLRHVYDSSHDLVNEFFVPVLGRSASYDRASGYFSSTALVEVARGLARFVAGGGVMRLICGVAFTGSDLEALATGEALSAVVAERLLADPLEGADIIATQRLESLCWLVREGRLLIRVGVPVDPETRRPLSRVESGRYFHIKSAVFADAQGNRIAVSGSNNETAAGLVANYESFSAYMSWEEQAWARYGRPVLENFEKLWAGEAEPGWVVLPLPDALRRRLVERAPDEPPRRDPEEPNSAPPAVRPEPPPGATSPLTPTPPAPDRVRLGFVAAAPSLGGGTGVGFATAAVTPWPHQLTTARRVVDTWPRSYLLADQVGLGKTIEAGLILRELLASNKASTVLILTPASVLRQWQEELAEKFGLLVPRLDAGRYHLRQAGEDTEVSPDDPSANPWRAFDVLLASSHLARRRDRRQEILAAGAWDVVIVDEAHHARRSGAKPADRANTLLALLRAMRAAGSWQALYLASATPMQMHAHEAWDLLELLDLTELWGESADNFVRYYTELRKPFPERDWDFLQRMCMDHESGLVDKTDTALRTRIRQELGLAASKRISDFARRGFTRATVLDADPPTRRWTDGWLRAATPMQDRVFRATRSKLRGYRQAGLLDASATIPQREVADRFVDFTPAEQKLYDRIEHYIGRHYNAYKDNSGDRHTPLGFIMTIYRRRLTSSLAAVERSLERRLRQLQDQAAGTAGGGIGALTDGDDMVADEAAGLSDDLSPPARTDADLDAEIAEIGRFLEDLGRRPPDESKMATLHDDISAAFRGGHSTVVVFTQYTDTMDYLREQLVGTYGSRVACWSGRGGERYNAHSKDWGRVPKADLKQLFRDGEDVKILLGTDSMSEGLNLQTCGFVVNYDMPWNFMRVEQRIGRLDRIGGRPTVSVRNYFYTGTVEEQIYRAIAADVDWFTDIVGPAQPVLGQVEAAITAAAMGRSADHRHDPVADAVATLRRGIDQAKGAAVRLEDAGSPRIQSKKARVRVRPSTWQAYSGY